MRLNFNPSALIALMFALPSLPSGASCSAIDSPSSTTLAPTSFPTPGQSCSGDTAFCIGDSTPIILRCENGALQPGNCDDNLNEPEFGAVCVTPPGQASSASCSAYTPPTSTSTTSTPFPTPGQSCTGDTSFCIGDSTPIILRCEDGSLQPGNCDDNLNEPEFGAVCVSFPGLASSASCSAAGPPTSTEGLPTSTITASTISPGGLNTTAVNGTFPSSSSPTSMPSSPPYATGAAGSTRSWARAAMVGVAALVAGGAMVL